jgi:hypothetical protein
VLGALGSAKAEGPKTEGLVQSAKFKVQSTKFKAHPLTFSPSPFPQFPIVPRFAVRETLAFREAQR